MTFTSSWLLSKQFSNPKRNCIAEIPQRWHAHCFLRVHRALGETGSFNIMRVHQLLDLNVNYFTSIRLASKIFAESKNFYLEFLKGKLHPIQLYILYLKFDYSDIESVISSFAIFETGNYLYYVLWGASQAQSIHCF